MKTKIAVTVMSFAFCLPLLAQENKTVKEETTVKRVVTKVGSNVTTTEVKSVEKEKGAVIVEGNENENQEFNEEVKKDLESKVLTDEVTIDQANQNAIEDARMKQEASLRESIAKEREKAAMEKKLMEEKKQAQLKELEENRKRLEHRPKSMSRLKNKKGN